MIQSLEKDENFFKEQFEQLSHINVSNIDCFVLKLYIPMNEFNRVFLQKNSKFVDEIHKNDNFFNTTEKLIILFKLQHLEKETSKVFIWFFLQKQNSIRCKWKFIQHSESSASVFDVQIYDFNSLKFHHINNINQFYFSRKRE